MEVMLVLKEYGGGLGIIFPEESYIMW